jgi:hypothetical protein
LGTEEMINIVIPLAVGLIVLLVGQRVRLAYQKKHDRIARINKVLEQYIATVNTIGNLKGALHAGVLELKDSSEIEEFMALAAKRNVTPPIPKIYADLLHGVDLYQFFSLLQNSTARMDAGDVPGLVEQLKQNKKLIGPNKSLERDE